jgi:hypothetical protein
MLAIMLGEQEAVVTEIRPLDLHGVTYYDIAVSLADGSTHGARLGLESVPDELRAGDRVLVTMAANMVVSLRRPEEG